MRSAKRVKRVQRVQRVDGSVDIGSPVDLGGRGLGLFGALALGPAFALACLSVGAHVAMLVGTGIRGGVVVSALLAAVLAVIAIPSVRSIVRRPSRIEVFALFSVGVLLVVLWDRAFYRSMTMPITYGVDQAHHGALIAYLAIEDHLPLPDRRLMGLVNYPIGAHIVPAIVSRMFGVTPLAAMWITAIASVAMIALLIAWVCRITAIGRSWTGFAIALAVWIAGWRLGIGLVTADFYYAQAVSLVFAIAGVGVCVLATRGLRLWRTLPVAALFAIAAYWSHPQQGIVVPVCMLLTLRRGWFARCRSAAKRHRFISALIASVVALATFAAIRIIRTSGYFTLGVIAGREEGVTVKLSVQTFGGPLVVALAVYASVELLGGALRGNRQMRVLSGAIGVPFGFAAGLWLLRVPWIAGVNVTQYRIVKNIYPAFPFLAIAIGVSASSAIRALRLRFVGHADRVGIPAVSVALGMATTLALAIRPPHLATMTTPLVDRGAYEIAIQATQTINPEDIGLVGDGIGPYVLWWMGIRRPIPFEVGGYPEVPRSVRWRTWPESGGEHYLIVDAENAVEFASKPGVEVLRQRRGAVLLRRTGA